jgi:hypothetical protein
VSLPSATVRAIEEKNHEVAKELATWRELSLSTDFVA